MKPRLYLAGPEVFLPNAAEIGGKKKALCELFGFKGLFPLDNEVKPDPYHDIRQGDVSRLIYNGNMAMLRAADAVIANLTPFRGVSADVGTAFEVGAAAALDKPVWGYTNAADDYLARVRAADHHAHQNESGAWFDSRGRLIEDFGGFDNLMLEHGAKVMRFKTWVNPFDDLIMPFIHCLKKAAAHFGIKACRDEAPR